jgi:hypothetical protein
MSTMWSLLHRKDMFYIFALEGKPYIPEITKYCGHFIETEELLSDIDQYPNTYRTIIKFNRFVSYHIN